MTMRIAIIGGSGFVGDALMRTLLAQDYDVTILSRSAAPRQLHARVNWQVYEPHRFSGALLNGCTCVINLVGILNKRILHPQDFQSAHVELVLKIIQACESVGIQRYLHVGALHANAEGPSEYLKTKHAGEAAAYEAKHLETTSFRPSVIFGPKDSFLNRFARLLKLSPLPIFPLACASSRFAPIYVGDLVGQIVGSINAEQTIGKSINLCGPKQYTLEEIVLYVASLLGKQVKVIPLPDSLARLQARFCDFVPGRPFSYDNYLSLQVDSVCEKSDTLSTTPMEDIAPLYIKP